MAPKTAAHHHLPAFAIATCLAAMAAFATSAPTLASDYSHTCADANSNYVINDEELYEADAYRAGNAQAVPHRVVGDQMLARRTGFCIWRGAQDGQSKFGYSFRQYLRTIEIGSGRDQVTVTLLCEEASDGLPAAARCHQQVEETNERARITLQSLQTSPSPSSPPRPSDNATASEPAGWDHNGSVMQLEADGNRRTFTYSTPRSGLSRLGVQPGTVLFEGVRDGDTYRGDAYVFSRTCGSRRFPVSGQVSPDQRQVVLSGEVSTINSACRRTGSRTEQLVFDLLGN